ncbi:MAG: murein biosynthesis integral membrane protein MurJ [Ferrimicrobium sp.]
MTQRPFRMLSRLLIGSRQSASQNATLMAVGTLASRLSGLVRLVVLAVVLGIHPVADAYNLANNTPNMLYDLLLGGVIAATLIPVLSARFRVGGEGLGQRSAATLVTVGLLALLVATVIFELLAPAIVGLYTVANHQLYVASQRQLAIELLRLFAPQLFFYGAISLFTALLNVKGNFAAAAFAPIVNNVVAIASLVVFSMMMSHPTTASVLGSRSAVVVLGLGSTAGVAAQMFVLLPVVARLRIDIRPTFYLRDPALREVFTLSSWTFGFVATNQIALFAILALADTRPGYVSAYNYAYLFFQLPYAIISFSVMSAIMPRLAQLFATKDVRSFSKLLGTGLRSGVGVTIPLAVVMAIGAPIGIRIVLGYGAVGPHGVALTASALTGFALGLPGFALFLALVQALQATRNARAVFILYLIENGLNVVLAWVLIGHEGVFGLSLSLAIAYSVASLCALILVMKMKLLIHPGPVIESWIRLALASAVGGVVLWLFLPLAAVPISVVFVLQLVFAAVMGSIAFVGIAAGWARLRGRGEERRRWQLR